MYKGLLGQVSARSFLSLPILVLLFCGYLRFTNLDWGIGAKTKAGFHGDERMVVSVDGALSTNHFDTDMKRAPIHEGLQLARYNFSSYFYASYIWYFVATPLERALHFRAVQTPTSLVIVFRQFSAIFGLLACALVYGCAKELIPAKFAALAALFTGVLPLLVQDSHYARAEAFVTAGAVGTLWLSFAIARNCSLVRCFWSGLLVGFLTACKISLAPLVLLPALSILAWHRSNLPQRLRFAVERSCLLVAGFVFGFLLGVPYVIPHWREWWLGWKFLKNQYSHPFPPFGPYPDGYCFGMINNYILSSFGAPLLIFAAIGVFHLLRRKAYFPLLLLIGPIALYELIFGFQLSFFERNISHVVPWIAILAAVGCMAAWDQIKRASAVAEVRVTAMTMVIVLCLWTPLTLSWRIAVVVFGGRTYDPTNKYETLIRLTYPGLPMIGDELWAYEVLEHIQQQLSSNPGGYILKLGDANDQLSRQQLFIAEHMFSMKLLASVPGPFSDLPTSTLQMYHGENYSWYLVRPN